METLRDKILLDEKIDKIDDVNFDKLYIKTDIETPDATSKPEEDTKPKEDLSSFREDEFFSEVRLDRENKKPYLKKKPLFFVFVSIALLLGVLFFYNLFVIKSLEIKVNAVGASVTSSFNVRVDNDFLAYKNT